MHWYKRSKFERYEQFVQRLSAACANHHIAIKEIASADEYKVHSLVINPEQKSTVAITAGTHGEEPGAPYGVLEWLERGVFPSSTRIVVIPLVNPYGFDHGTRRNQNNQDTNRHFIDAKATDANEAIVKNLISTKPSFLLDFHEDEDKKDFYLYASHKAPKSVIQSVRTIASKYFSILDQKEVYDSPLDRGVVIELPIHHSDTLDKYLLERGTNYITTEAPGKAPMKDRVEFVVQVINTLLG